MRLGIPKRIDMQTFRTHTCGELRKGHEGQVVRLSGWLHNKRNLGGVLFLDLRDHYGITQLVVRPDAPFADEMGRHPKETVLRIDGKVSPRPTENVNPKLETGEVEVEIEAFEVLGSADPLPFSIFPEEDAPEETRLRYRYLDLRRSQMHRNIVLRSKIIASIRRRMTERGFNEFQTPTLTVSSPEGARDFLVPSRLHPGKFYALPQAPQQFKQLLMVAGFDRYFQIAPCYRDEDARADRSPGEFYQLDIEMSFVTQDELFAVIEEVMEGLFREFAPSWTITAAPFPRIPFEEAMRKYGSDKPDLRIPLEIRDVSGLFREGSFRAFAGKTVRALAVPGCSDRPRSFFDQTEARAKADGAGGLAWLVVQEDGTFKGPVAKFLTEETSAALRAATGAGVGHAVFLMADADLGRICKVMGGLRTHLGTLLEMVEEDVYRFCWITDFPMYEKDEATGAVAFSHNPFSMPQGGMDALNSMDPLDIKAYQYDIVCNGYELSSGAIRNHRPDIMYRAFEIAGYGRAEVDARFSGMINAFKMGAPPHGGIAPGVDRIVMLLAQEPNIREVIAFPMNQKAQDLMMGAPAPVSERQLRDLHIKLELPKE